MLDDVCLAEGKERKGSKTVGYLRMDLCSRRIPGITVSYTMQTSTLIHALDQACKLRGTLPEKPLIFHSDRGSQFNADRFRTELTKRNIQQSMSGVGNCFDNASMESVWSRMKSELRQYMLFDDLKHACSIAFVEYIRSSTGSDYILRTTT